MAIDEASVFLSRLLKKVPERGERWLHTLRSWQQQAPGLRILLTGSIGLGTLATR